MKNTKKIHDSSDRAPKYLCFQCDTNFESRPTFSNGLINTNRPVYIIDNDLAAVGVDSMKLLIQ